MKFVFLVGNISVGKMTVGQELAKITELRLFYNHMTIEPVIEVFGEFRFDITMELRDVFFKRFAESQKYGMIHTMVWNFDKSDNEIEYVEHIKSIFDPFGTEYYFVELVAPQNVRLERSATENRLKYKPSMRHLDFARERLINHDKIHRGESKDGEFPFNNYIRIDNTTLTAVEAAKMIKETFNL